MSCFKRYGKIIGIMWGICLMTGSLCACGDDTSVTISLSELAEPGTEQVVSAETQEASTASGAQEQEEVESPDIVTVTISAAGDVSLGSYPEQEYAWSLPQVYEQVGDPAYFFENVADVFAEDDMTIVNLEGVLTEAEERRQDQKYCIKGKPEYVKALPAGNIEAVSFANNHRRDYLQKGSDDTVALLEQEGIVYAYDSNVCVYETKGIQIGYVSISEVSRGSAIEQSMKDGIEKLKELEPDIILACCHWGTEGEHYPDDYQTELGRKCIDWGADLVIGHHPHVIQGIDTYKDKYIVYSLGNFCFGANRNPADKDCIIFQQTFTFVNGEKQDMAEARIIPCSISSVKERNDYKPTVAIGEDAERIIKRMQEYSMEYGTTFDENGKILRDVAG